MVFIANKGMLYYIAEAEKIASKVGILKDGKIVMEKEVNLLAKGETVKIVSADTDRIINFLKHRKGGRVLNRSGNDITYRITKGTREQLVNEIVMEGMKLSEFYRLKDDLEQLYFNFN
jgi:ABC-type multidrug transport system ATPase subunit